MSSRRSILALMAATVGHFLVAPSVHAQVAIPWLKRFTHKLPKEAFPKEFQDPIKAKDELMKMKITNPDSAWVSIQKDQIAGNLVLLNEWYVTQTEMILLAAARN